jgi:hypothetical protein
MANYLPGLTLNHNPPDLSLLSSLDYRSEPLVPGSVNAFPIQQLARAHKRLILNYILIFIIISETKQIFKGSCFLVALSFIAPLVQKAFPPRL